jgi:hypothetical protein
MPWDIAPNKPWSKEDKQLVVYSVQMLIDLEWCYVQITQHKLHIFYIKNAFKGEGIAHW